MAKRVTTVRFSDALLRRIDALTRGRQSRSSLVNQLVEAGVRQLESQLDIAPPVNEADSDAAGATVTSYSDALAILRDQTSAVRESARSMAALADALRSVESVLQGRSSA